MDTSSHFLCNGEYWPKLYWKFRMKFIYCFIYCVIYVFIFMPVVFSETPTDVNTTWLVYLCFGVIGLVSSIVFSSISYYIYWTDSSTKLLKFNATYFDKTHESKVLTAWVNDLREVLSIGLDPSSYTFEVLAELRTTPLGYCRGILVWCRLNVILLERIPV